MRILFSAALALVFAVLGCTVPKKSNAVEMQLKDDHKAQITAILKAGKMPAPQSIEVTDQGYLAVTFQVGRLNEMQARTLAEEALWSVRTSMLVLNKPMRAYRVSVNGPPPSPGYILRYGTARLIEGNSLTWEVGQ